MPPLASETTIRPIEISGGTSQLNHDFAEAYEIGLDWLDEVVREDEHATVPARSVPVPIVNRLGARAVLSPPGAEPAAVYELDDLLLWQQIQEHAAEATEYRTGDRGSMTRASIWQVEKIRGEIKSIFDKGRERALLEPCIYDNEVLNILKYFDNVNELVAGDYEYLTPEQLEEKVNKNDFENLPPLYARLLKSRKSKRELDERTVQELRAKKAAPAESVPEKETTTQIV